MGILPIACEMRTPEHVAYTPAPDIVHEAAGHAPILADPEFAKHLHAYGEVARKAIFSTRDLALYEAILALSVTKEDPASTPKQIEEAQARLDQAVAALDYVSEAQELARMNWWSVEYGLVGTMDNPKIYGAGLLSSVSEGYNCLGPEVKKLAFTIDCIKTSYDITKPQPQLFVTPDFPTLTKVLDEYAQTMAFKIGGLEALKKAKRAGTVVTTQFDSGIQISGVVGEYFVDDNQSDPLRKVTYLKINGPTQLAYGDQEIKDQGPEYHQEGFSTCIGKLKGLGKSPADLSDHELQSLPRLVFESGIEVEGKLKSTTKKDGRNIILSFENCTVRMGEKILFNPEWGMFDLACGEAITSVFGGAADRGRYLKATGGFKQPPAKPKTNATPENLELATYYAKVRELRESKVSGEALLQQLESIYSAVTTQYANDWLLLMELLELNSKHKLQAKWEKPARDRLQQIAQKDQEVGKLVSRGLKLIA